MALSADGKTGVKKLHRDKRREAILRGAAKAFVRNGYDATSLDDITREAGISRTLLYRHFDTKKDVYTAILKGDEKFSEPEGLAEPAKAVQRVDHLIELAQTEPDRFRLLFRHAAREPEFREYMEERSSLGASFVDKALKQYISDNKKRRLAAFLLRDTVINILLTWTDCGCPNPAMMPNLITKVIESIVSSIENS